MYHDHLFTLEDFIETAKEVKIQSKDGYESSSGENLMNLDQQFRKVVSSPLATLSAEDLKPIALAVWHEDYAPNLNYMGLHELQKAGYVFDRLDEV